MIVNTPIFHYLNKCRPLVIWAVQWAWERFCNTHKEFEHLSESLLRLNINDPLDEVPRLPEWLEKELPKAPDDDTDKIR